MSYRLAKALLAHAAATDVRGAETRAGTVTSIGPDCTTVRVTVLPEGNLTGWIPVAHIGVGANSVIAPPNIGDFVTVQPHEGDSENWIMTGRMYNTQQPPPVSPVTSKNVQPGEVAVINKSGSTLHMTADGNVSVIGKTTISITAPTISMTGNLQVSGSVTAGYGTGNSVGLQTHTHRQPNDSHGDLEQPTDAPTAGT